MEEAAVSFTDSTEGKGETESPITKGLRKFAAEIQVIGAMAGKYYLIPYQV